MSIVNWRRLGRNIYAFEDRIRGIGAALTPAAAKRCASAGGKYPEVSGACVPPFYSLKSPSGVVTARISKRGTLTYSVSMNGKTVVEPSPMGITVKKGVCLGREVLTGEPEIKYESESYYMVETGGEVTDSHVKYVFPVRHVPTGFEYLLEVKLWDDGFGFRFVFPKKSRLLIEDEITAFNMPADSLCRYQTDVVKLQGITVEKQASRLPAGEDFACLTQFELAGGGYAIITEANLNNYAGAALRSLGGGKLKINFWDSGVFYCKGCVSPWRVVICCETEQELADCHVISHANDAASPELERAEWIKPGKAGWSYFVNQEHSRDYDVIMGYNALAAKMGFEYSLIDAGWRLWALTERGAFKKAGKVAKDAEEKGIGIWLWKSAVSGPLSKCYRRYFFKQCVKAGAKGVKIDHNESETRVMINFYRDFVREAAEHKLMVIYHNPQKPTGLSRTYPNLLSMEAVRGMQCGCDAHDSTIIPFTRLVAGGADYTPFCFSVPRRRGNATLCHILGTGVVINSPFLTVSEDAGILLRHAAGEFVRALPAVWNETRVLPGTKPGEAVYYARRNGDVWFVAGLNGSAQTRAVDISLGFLDEGAEYTLVLFTDGDEIPAFNRVELSVCSKTVLGGVEMKPFGGFAGFAVKNGEK